MGKKSALTRLRKMGYSRFEDYTAPLQRETAPPKPKHLEGQNFKGNILNHTIMEYITLENCDYNSACVTGSIFRNCKFINCSLDQADFEFCEFYHCEFEIKEISNCSFNGSSFIETSFCSVHFDSCTFTSAFFQKCPFDGVEISYSTLENAVLKRCSFFHMDLRYLNMDYVDLDQPYMEDVTLPISQTPFMFGALQYLKATKDIVFVSKGSQGRMAPAEFFREAAPLLCSHFTKTKQYFPLANIYLAEKNIPEGMEAIQKGVLGAMAVKDIRMAKHFCKLTASSGAFRPSAVRDLYYNYICRVFPQHSEDKDIPNYARHIMEIKALLFSYTKSPSVSVSLETDIPQEEPQKTGTLIDWIFSIAKGVGSFQSSDIEVVLSYHSPLTVTIRIHGEEEVLAALLSAYLNLTGMTDAELLELPVVSAYRRGLPLQTEDREREAEELIRACRRELRVLSVHLSLLEYYVENFRTFSPGYETGYYFNGKSVPGQAVLLQDHR